MMQMQAASSDPVGDCEERFTWACGKCGGRNLYRDRDHEVRDYFIACLTCGERYYADAGMGTRRKQYAPVKVYLNSRPALSIDASHFIQERTANIVTGTTGRSRRRFIVRRDEEEGMAYKACGNCGRVKTIVGEGHCSVCFNAGRGLEGEARIAVLAAVKTKIENGEIKPRGNAGPSKKQAAPKGEPDKEGFREIGPHTSIREVILEPGEAPAIVPVTLRLAIEITVRVATVTG